MMHSSSLCDFIDTQIDVHKPVICSAAAFIPQDNMMNRSLDIQQLNSTLHNFLFTSHKDYLHIPSDTPKRKKTEQNLSGRRSSDPRRISFVKTWR